MFRHTNIPLDVVEVMPFLKQVNARQKKTSSSCYSKTMKQISLWSYFRAFYAVGAIPRYRGSPAATTSVWITHIVTQRVSAHRTSRKWRFMLVFSACLGYDVVTL